MLTRHTVAGLPQQLSANSDNNSYKTRPALSVHTFDPPETQFQQIENKIQNSQATYASINGISVKESYVSTIVQKEIIECKLEHL